MIDLYKGECLTVMDELIVKGIVVDAIIADIPYGTTNCSWDSVIPFDEMWLRLNKLIKPNGAIVLFGSEPFSSALRMSNIKNYKYDWKWDKVKPTAHGIAKYQPLRRYEDIMIFNGNIYNPQMVKKDKPRIAYGSSVTKDNEHKFGYKKMEKYEITHSYPQNILKISNANQKGKQHPTQKPVALMEYLVKTYTNENELVLDFTMGSGTTGLACKNLNRKFIGIEMDDKYFEIAKKRIKENKC